MLNFTAQKPFILPSSLTGPVEQVNFCIGIIDKFRRELPSLRREKTILEKQREKLENELEFWREKCKKEKVRNNILRKEKGRLEKEIGNLKDEIDKLTKTNRRYSIALFDHGNFKSPDDKEDRKSKGGQTGHPDTNRETHEDYSCYKRKRLFAKTCGQCGHKLKRVSSVKQKILIDIVINPEVIKMILESERQWCGNCKTAVTAKDPRTLPFTEYGINTFMMVMVLRFKCHSSMKNISTVISISHGLKLSKSDVSNILKQAKLFLKSRYHKLIEIIREGKVMYSDETGWLVNGQSAWMWIMANEDTTIYFAAESRGKGIAEELYGKSNAFSMHDGLASYQSSTSSDKQCYCWSHFLRYAFEETINEKEPSEAILLRDELVRIYRIKMTHPEYSRDKLKNILNIRLDQVLKVNSKNQSILNIQNRLKTQKEGLINSLLYTNDGTNNLAERELRNMAIKKRISFGSASFSGMETTAIIGSIMQTLGKKEENLIPSLQSYLRMGIQGKYQQYTHTAFYDSS